jgi:squalene-associated FAD-dependent desaturase
VSVLSRVDRDGTNPVVIVGGGLAGLAAFLELSRRRIPVTLLESRPRLGGRASSFVDRATGSAIDNCQHVAMGCCTNFEAFCDTLLVTDFFRREERLWFVGPDKRISRFAAGPWPAPLHLAGAFGGLKHLTWRDRLAIAHGLRALARENNPERLAGQSFGDWLAHHGQSPGTIERFWHVVLVSALSETVDRVNVAAARKVFCDGFLRHHSAWEVLIPTRPLGELYDAPLADWTNRVGGEIRTGTGVSRVIVTDGRATGVVLRDGSELPASGVILAVPPWLVGDMLVEAGPLPETAGLDQLEFAPIASVHLWFDREVCPLPHAAFVGHLTQWVFNHARILRSPDKDTHALQVVISASRGVGADDEGREGVIRRVVDELAAVWPQVRDAKLLHSRMVVESKAALSMLPGVERFRPPQRTALPGLYLAGDYTRTGWPSTMEGAVRSGYLAAERVLEDAGRAERIARPDLPVATLSRWLYGLR